MQLIPFHIAVQIRDIGEARDFYGVKRTVEAPVCLIE